MAVNRSITAVNSVFSLAVLNLFPNPIQLQGYAMDDVFSAEPVDAGEFQMGVDGILSAGFIWKEVDLVVNLQANSPSIVLFDQWRSAEVAVGEKYQGMGTLTLPALGKKLALSTIFLKKWPPFSDVKKVQQPQKFTLTIERVQPSLM